MSTWPAEKEQLWQAAVERSQRRASDFAKPRDAKKKVEKSVVEALRLGDVKKVLQTLIIAPKTDATLKCLKKLHPSGSACRPL